VFDKDLFQKAGECANVSEKGKIEIFRILDNYPIKDSVLVFTEKLCESYTSLLKFVLGESRNHVRQNPFEVAWA
jgi:hypothetical protein